MKERYDDLIVFYSNKSDGNMATKYGEEADSNRIAFIKKMDLPLERFLFMQPDNLDVVVELKEEIVNSDNLYYKLVEADAIVCKVPNVYLYLNFGDCIPFVIYDAKKQIFAFAHLGWRSTYLNLHQKLFSIFKEEYHSNIEDLKIYIGPCIKKESYLLPNPKQKEEKAWENYVEYVRDDLYSIDLVGYVKDYFQNNGIKIEQMIVSPIDTYQDPNYFSHYQDCNGKEGRFLFGVGMKKGE